MPVDPAGEWTNGPFDPVIREGRIWARGANDDKGQSYMHLKAMEAMLATGTLPCNLKFMLEGEGDRFGQPWKMVYRTPGTAPRQM
ncbi:MAG: M20/M25/M40 family metallo-hydrolase [Alistipes indistinctus]